MHVYLTLARRLADKLGQGRGSWCNARRDSGVTTRSTRGATPPVRCSLVLGRSRTGGRRWPPTGRGLLSSSRSGSASGAVRRRRRRPGVFAPTGRQVDSHALTRPTRHGHTAASSRPPCLTPPSPRPGPFCSKAPSPTTARRVCWVPTDRCCGWTRRQVYSTYRLSLRSLRSLRSHRRSALPRYSAAASHFTSTSSPPPRAPFRRRNLIPCRNRHTGHRRWAAVGRDARYAPIRDARGRRPHTTALSAALTPPHPTPPHPTSPHLTSHHLTSPYHTSPRSTGAYPHPAPPDSARPYWTLTLSLHCRPRP